MTFQTRKYFILSGLRFPQSQFTADLISETRIRHEPPVVEELDDEQVQFEVALPMLGPIVDNSNWMSEDDYNKMKQEQLQGFVTNAFFIIRPNLHRDQGKRQAESIKYFRV